MTDTLGNQGQQQQQNAGGDQGQQQQGAGAGQQQQAQPPNGQNGQQQQQQGTDDNPFAHLPSDADKQKYAQENASWRNQAREAQQAAERQAAELQELRQFREQQEAASRTELENAQHAAQTAAQKATATEEALHKANMQLSVLQSDRIGDFHSATAVLKFIPDYDPKIEANGTITNLGDIFDRIAKEHSYLLKTSTGGGANESKANGQQDGEGAGGAAPSGSPFNGKKQDGSPDRAHLETVFPALRDR